ncbi:MAG: hypothetical protein IPK27_08075 [Rhodanobacteraceae bacterium]|nr:hypothetical protein [Rhodanobacteraceae bacterium]
MHLLRSLLFCAASLLAGAARPADEVPDPLAELTERAQAHRVLLVGELHGSWEVPGIVAGLATNLLADERPLLVGLEIWRSEQAALDRYLASAGTGEDRERLLAGPFWATRDGRSSEAVVALIERLRALALKAPLAVVAFDIEAESDITGAERDRSMGELLLARLESMPDARLLVLAGNFHTRIQSGAPWDPAHDFMGHFLREQDPYAVEIMGVKGSTWMCPDPEHCRAWQMPEAPFEPGLTLGDTLNDRRHHGVWWLPQISASPPATGADEALLQPLPLKGD